MVNLRWKFLNIGLALLAFTAGLIARTPQGTGALSDSAEVKRIFQEDQADRDIDYESMTEQQRKEWRERAHARDVLHYKQMTDIIARASCTRGPTLRKLR